MLKRSNSPVEPVLPEKTLTGAQLDREIGLYLEDRKEAEPFFRLYRDLFQIQRRYSSRIESDCTWCRERYRQLFLEGRCLLSERGLSIDPALYRLILGEIVEAFVSIFTQAGPLRKIMDLPELSGSRLPGFLAGNRLPDSGALEKQVRAWGWRDEGAVDALLVAGTVKDALAPFYTAFAGAARAEIDLALWSEGRCPVCGQDPGMAMLDEGGARILECFFCRTRWQFPRLECPFCRNRDPQKLGYFHADEFPGRRVQVCERCKSYLKTVVLKEVGREVILGLEEVYTMELDFLARREGYRAGRDLAVLQ